MKDNIFLNSLKNQRVKYLKRLKKRKFREAEKKFLAEGLRFVEEALNSKWEVEALIYTLSFKVSQKSSELFKAARERKIPLWETSDNVMNVIADTETPQGIAALVGIRDVKAEDIICGESPLLLVVDGVQDPGNLGTMIRNADAAGVDGVILLKGTVDLYNPKTLRASMGSLFHVPVIYMTFEEFAEKIINENLQILVGVPKGGIPVWKVDLTLPTALVVANEAHGASSNLKAAADSYISIPMPGKTESLNAATAAAILLYETVRQRS